MRDKFWEGFTIGFIIGLTIILGIAIFSTAQSYEPHEPYQPGCTEIHKQDSSPRRC